MRHVEHCPAGGFVDTARFKTDEAVLHHVDPAHPMLACKLVELRQQLRRTGRFAVDLGCGGGW